MKTYERLTSALERVGAHLKRDRNHLVYELPNGKNFVVAKSPSDYRAEQNALSDLAAVAGVDVREKRTKAPADVRAERRARPGRAGAAPWAKPLPALADALRSTGLVEQSLRSELEASRGEVAAMEAEITRLRALLAMGWRERLAAWWRS